MALDGELGHATSRAIEADVLIIGGGVQGLWVLKDLRSAGYAALLLERNQLGGEQTCHSHVYIHRGHLYREEFAELAEQLQDVRALWNEFLASHAVGRGILTDRSFFGFQNPADAKGRMDLWDKLGLDYSEVDVPQLLGKGTAIRKVLATREACLNAEWLVRQLSSGLESFIGEVERVERVTVVRGDDVHSGSDRVEQVDVIIRGARLAVRPKALILAAGAGNQALLELAAGGDRALSGRVKGAQQIRKGHMLVVSGERDFLQPLIGIFPDLGGLFIVAREEADRVTWLISDNRSPTISFVEDWLERDPRWWLRKTLFTLGRLAPHYFDSERSRARLAWGVYDGPKAEGAAIGAIPREYRIERFGTTNLWALWPTKLTLAPKVSAQVHIEVRNLLGQPMSPDASIRSWNDIRRPVEIARERWRKTPMLSWNDFKRCFSVDYS